MPYYVRAFCTAASPVPLSAIVASVREAGVAIRADVGDDQSLDSSEWTACEIIYNAARQPVLVECNRDDGEQSLARGECQEFVEELEEQPASPQRDRVIKHLRTTRFMVVCQLLSDIDDTGYAANGEFLHYFVKHCGGMVQADGEGFYEGAELLVELD